MSESSAAPLTFNVIFTIPPNIIREYFDGLAKVEAVKKSSGSSTDSTTSNKILSSFADMFSNFSSAAKSKESCDNWSTKACKGSTTVSFKALDEGCNQVESCDKSCDKSCNKSCQVCDDGKRRMCQVCEHFGNNPKCEGGVCAVSFSSGAEQNSSFLNSIISAVTKAGKDAHPEFAEQHPGVIDNIVSEVAKTVKEEMPALTADAEAIAASKVETAPVPETKVEVSVTSKVESSSALPQGLSQVLPQGLSQVLPQGFPAQGLPAGFPSMAMNPQAFEKLFGGANSGSGENPLESIMKMFTPMLKQFGLPENMIKFEDTTGASPAQDSKDTPSVSKPVESSTSVAVVEPFAANFPEVTVQDADQNTSSGEVSCNDSYDSSDEELVRKVRAKTN